MAKKRRRSNDWDDDDFGEQWKAEPIHEDVVADRNKGQFRAAGLACRKCSFVTTKTGFSGKQSLRAHQKVHKRERRARDHPAYRQLAWTALVTGLMILFALIGPVSRIEVVQPLFVGIGFAGLGVILVVSQLLVADRAVESADRKTTRLGSTLVNMSRLVGILVLGAGYLGMIDWYWTTTAPLLMLVGVPTVSNLGLAALNAKRGRYRSPNYAQILKPRSEEVQDLQSDYEFGLRQKVQSGRMNPIRAPGRLKRHYNALGLPALWRRGRERRKKQAEERKAESARRRERNQMRRR